MSLNAQKTREFSPNVLRRIKLRTRLFVTFLIISLVPVITIGIFSYHAYTQSMNEKVKQAALQSIELLNNNMSTQLGIYSDYIGSISVSDTVQNGVASVNNGHPLTSDIVSGIGENDRHNSFFRAHTLKTSASFPMTAHHLRFGL